MLVQGMVARRWAEAVAELGGRPTGAGAELERRYGEPHRRYHDLDHVRAVLDHVAELAADCGLAAQVRAHLVLAACAHDVVYDGRPGQDERCSADWAAAALADAGVGATDRERVRELVLLTAEHACYPSDVAAAVLLDADLAILAAPPNAYAAYVGAVRTEYLSVPDEQWRTGRGALLRDLLARDHLFVSEAGRRRWEHAARANVEAELAGLHEPLPM